MKNIKYLTSFIKCYLSYKGLIKTPKPHQITFSITSACQSLCKTCNIGKNYKKNPSIVKKDLTLEEIEKIFKSIGPIYFFNISGGEPYLRKDFPKIIELACKYLKPKIIHIPTNALMPQKIKSQTKEIIEIINKNNKKTLCRVKPSFDGINEKHDFIRGVRGNFNKLIETYKELKRLQKEFPNLEVGLGTVISKYNIKDIKEVVDYALNLEPDTYINEIAENREEMFNMHEKITPTSKEYTEAMNYFSKEVAKEIHNKKGIKRITQAFRLVYYDLTSKILNKKVQVIPCYAGIISAHIDPKGLVWACSILAYKKPLGDLQKNNYNFYKVWHSNEAKEVRRYIKEGKCFCPMANASYYNILFHFPSLIKAIKYIVFPNSYKRN